MPWGLCMLRGSRRRKIADQRERNVKFIHVRQQRTLNLPRSRSVLCNLAAFMSRRSSALAAPLLAGLLALLLPADHLRAQLLPSFGDSRTGTTGMQFLKIAPDARSAGMAGVFSAVVDDVSALYWNPAGICGVDSNRINAQLGHTAYFADVTLNYGGVVYRVSDRTFLGLSLVYLNSGEMDVTTEFLPMGNGQTFRASNTGVTLTLARQLTDQFRFGASARYVNEQIASLTTHNAVFDFGFQYDIGLANTRFAVGLSNFGFNTQPTGDLIIEDLDGPSVATEFEEISVPAVFRLGLAWDPLSRDAHRLTMAAQLNHPTDNNETYGVGFEYAWKELLLLRTGYLLGLDQTGLPSAGFGVYLPRRYGSLRLDYGFSARQNLGAQHRLTLGFSLIGKQRKASAPRSDEQSLEGGGPSPENTTTTTTTDRPNTNR